MIVNKIVLAGADLPGGAEAIVAAAKLEIVDINYDKRWVKLKNENGEVEQIDVGIDVRNFDQIKVGDVVNIDYIEDIQVQVFNPDEVRAGAVADAEFVRSEEGEKPAAAAIKNLTLVATISAIDLENKTVTLQDKAGNSKTFPSRNPDNLSKVKVGDKVMFSFTRILLISVVDK